MVRESLHIIRDEHAAVAAMLRSLSLMVQRGPGDAPDKFFDVLRAMLFYIDEFPERQHHPKDSELLFPKVLQVAPQVGAVIDRLDQDHARSEAAVRELQPPPDRFKLGHVEKAENRWSLSALRSIIVGCRTSSLTPFP